MANDGSKRWEQQVRDAAARVEEDLRRVVAYINDEVVPEIRANGSQALRVAAGELQKLAERMDDHRAAAHGEHSQEPPGSGASTPEGASAPEGTPAPKKDRTQP